MTHFWNYQTVFWLLCFGSFMNSRINSLQVIVRRSFTVVLESISTVFYMAKITIILYYLLFIWIIYVPCMPFSLIKTKDKLSWTQLRGKRRWGVFLQHILWLHFHKKFSLLKYKWACHHRSENSFGLEPVFVGLYGSAFTKSFYLREGKALKSSCYDLSITENS